MLRRYALVVLVSLSLMGCDMLGEYQARKDATKVRLQSGGPLPAAGAPAPGVPNAGQPMPMPMPMGP